MFIRFFIFIFIFTCASQAEAQHWCEVNDRFDQATESLIQKHISKIRSRSEKWFEVVVHDVSKDSPPISFAQVVHQIDVLNNDFAKRGENILKLREEFVHLAADAEIRFCLAKEDPDGNPTNGLTYTNTDFERIALERDIHGRPRVYYDESGGKTGWDPTRYINIWVADYGESGILGYGSLPGTAPYPEEIGLVMDRKYFGSIGTATNDNFFNRGHTLTHEMGHFFGLLHIWGDDDASCNDSDEVEDTPNAIGPYLGCPSGRQESCGVSNMYQNFMDLTDDRCLAAFTHGQVMRMHTVIDLFYQELAQNSPCGHEIQTFQEWWDDLVWAFDESSGKYVIFNTTSTARNLDIQVFTVDGRRIINDKMNEEKSFLINLHGRAPGIYFVQVSDGGERFVSKIIKY